MKSVEIQIAAIEEAIRLGRAGEAAYLMKVCAQYEIDNSTLARWMGKVKNLPRSEWPTALQGCYKGRQFSDMTPEAWEFFVGQYRQSASISAAHKACLARAPHEGWQVPSERTFQRKLAREKLLLPRRRRYADFDA